MIIKRPLEKPAQRMQVERDVELFLQENRGRLICFDEIQLLPKVFQTFLYNKIYLMINEVNPRYGNLIEKDMSIIKSRDKSI